MKYIVMLVMSLLSVSAMSRTILPESVTTVELSNTDMNRVVCESGDIGYFYFSEEKWIETRTNGRNGFIKFKFVDDGVRQVRASQRSEFYIVCNHEVYTLMAYPKPIEGVTLHLAPGKQSVIKKNLDRFSTLPLEQKVVEITQTAYLDRAVEGVNRVRLEDEDRNPLTQLSPKFELIPHQKWWMEGVELELTEYLVTARVHGQISEEDFLSPLLGENIIGITLTQYKLDPMKISRLLIVRSL